MRHLMFHRRLAVLVAATALLIWAVPGSVASATQRTSATSSSARLVLPLTLRHQAALSAYVAAVDKKGSAEYHHFLTPAQYRRRFGASPAEIAGVLAKLRGLGLSGARVSANHMYVSVAAPVRGARRSARVAASVKSALGGLVSAVITPSQMPVMEPQITTVTRQALMKAEAGSSDRTAKTVRSGVDGGATPCLAAATAYNAYTAPQLASAYNFNGMYAAGYHGEGISAAVMEYGGYHSSNVTAFDQCYGISTPVSRELVDGGTGSVASSSEGEVTLDIDVLNEMAPDLAHLYVYEAPDTGQGIVDGYAAFVTEDKAKVLSVSWGECEEDYNQNYEKLVGAIMEEAAAQGQQIFVSAGDSGSRSCETDPEPVGSSLSADSEASIPWVTGVGGTDLSQDSVKANATVHREDVWNDGSGAGGGGQSVVWAMPSWQRDYLTATGDDPAGMTNDCGAPAGEDCRMEPDIALDADGEEGGGDPALWDAAPGPVPAQFTQVGDKGSPGFSVYCASSDCYAGGSGWQPVGGTSAASPLAAAAAVLWDQEAQSSGVSLGFLNPALYAVASNPTDYARDFYDVASGNNDDEYTTTGCEEGCGTTDYQAGTGYDMATGLGALNVANLGADLVANAGAVTLTPDTEKMYGYTDGGPTTTASVSITATTNTATGNAYTASSDASWLVLDAASGTAPSSLQWHVDPAGLAKGTYTGHITVTAQDGSTATLTVTYQVTPRAEIGLLTKSLHFYEHQVKPAGAKHTEVCTAPLWADELEADGALPGALDLSAPGDRAKGTYLSLGIKNTGAAGSVLHYSLDERNINWAGSDSEPNGKAEAVQWRPGRPLVPTEGSLSAGTAFGVQLASYANGDLVSGTPALQQGTYHGTIVIRDLADPSDTRTVPVTLTLGDGRGTPRVGTDKSSVAVTAAPGQTKVVKLGLTDPGGACGYGYTLQTGATWLESDIHRRAGTVHAHSTWQVPLSFHVPATMAAGTYHSTVTITSTNSQNTTLRVPVTLTVS